MARQFAAVLIRIGAPILAAGAFVTGAASAVAQAPCTHETLVVRGVRVGVDLCVAGPARAGRAGEIVVPVQAAYHSPNGSFVRLVDLHFVAGESVSRVMESLDLNRVGLTGTLHLTLAYAKGLVRLEGALLTPGALTIK